MYLELTPEYRAPQEELRAYPAAMMTPEPPNEIKSSEGSGPLYRAALKRLGADGWLGLG